MKPSKLLQSAGWLAVLLMLGLASPGLRVDPVGDGPSVAQVEPHR